MRAHGRRLRVSSLLRRDALLRRTLALVDVIAAYAALLIAIDLVGMALSHFVPGRW